MTSIKDISYDEIESLLRDNDIKIPENEDDAYKLAFEFIMSGKDYQASDQIFRWITAYNFLHSKKKIAKYGREDIAKMSNKQLKDLAKLLDIETNNSDDLIGVLKYLHKFEYNYHLDLDYKTLANVYGRPLANALKDLGVDKIINVYDYEQDEPGVFYISGSGGSFDFDSKYGLILMHHGYVQHLGRLGLPDGYDYLDAKFKTRYF